MMTTIKATCPTCGEVDLTANDIDLRISNGDEGSSYGFGCPVCREPIRKPADSRVIQLLLSGGVKANIIVGERTEFDGPAFTYDDLIDFHFQLESDNFLADLLHDD
jgi:hypothetical protein